MRRALSFFGLIFLWSPGLTLLGCDASSSARDAGDQLDGQDAADADDQTDGGDSFDAADERDGGDSADGADQDPDDPCSPAFAQRFAEPLALGDRPTVLEAFSPDCRQVLSVDQADGRLRVVDLIAQTTHELASDVSWAEFTPDGARVVFLTPDGDYSRLWVAHDGRVEPIASGVALFSVSADGSRVAYLVDWDPDAVGGTLRVSSLETPAQAPIVLSSGAFAYPLFIQGAAEVAFLAQAEAQVFDSPNIHCDWYTAELRAAPTTGGDWRVLASEVVASGFWALRDEDRLLAAFDYDCEAQTFRFGAIPLGPGAPTTVAVDVPMGFGAAFSHFVEPPGIGSIVHPGRLIGDAFELAASDLAGTQKQVLAVDLIPSPWFAMGHVPFRLAGAGIILYLQAQSLALRGVDLEAGEAWGVTPGPTQYLFFAPAPDGLAVLHLRGSDDTLELVLSPTRGGRSTSLLTMTGRFSPPEWTPSGERVLVESEAADGLACLQAIDPLSGQIEILHDGTNWSAHSVHPSGWLVVVGTPAGARVIRIP